MIEIKQGQTTNIPVRMVSNTDVARPITGVPTSALTIYYSKNGSSATSASTGSVTWSELQSTYMPGMYMFTPSSSMVDTAGPLVIQVSAASAYPAAILVDVVAALQIDTYGQITGVPFAVWNQATSATFATGSFGKNLELARKILTNKTVDTDGGLGVSTIVVYDDPPNENTIVGTFYWYNSTGTRSKLS